MTTRCATEKDPIRQQILAAMDRLLAGEPLRSSGRLSVSQLAVEAGVGRWHLTHQHVDLKELFQARCVTPTVPPPRSPVGSATTRNSKPITRNCWHTAPNSNNACRCMPASSICSRWRNKRPPVRPRSPTWDGAAATANANRHPRQRPSEPGRGSRLPAACHVNVGHCQLLRIALSLLPGGLKVASSALGELSEPEEGSLKFVGSGRAGGC